MASGTQHGHRILMRPHARASRACPKMPNGTEMLICLDDTERSQTVFCCSFLNGLHGAAAMMAYEGINSALQGARGRLWHADC